MDSQSVRPLLDDICAAMEQREDRGRVADYIPELAGIDPDQFGISICLADGQQLSAGDATTGFSVQSVSKVFTLAIALGRYGSRFWDRVGREPSTLVFNSVQELETRDGIPPNPFVNSGAIVTTDSLLVGATPKETLAEIIQFVRQAASDDDIYMDPEVAASENASGHRNRSLAHFLRACGNLRHDCDLTLGTYFHHCALEMTCEQLARTGRFLAGLHPSGHLIQPGHIRSINALMMTCGHYNGSGEFAYRVGIPGKSGVGGGILAIVPRRASIAVWSPGLDQFGNSLRGTAALAKLTHLLRLSVFSVS
ncbi:glutaminase [Tropicimonas sp. TH_r6]|uniref:glutaminase n=1 Tax=Tropicimonas sp. TH_r6 TaxID=3082085 RepID=UPI0029547609|nr:glutaminase [Tropicimonas sp. TH_r6]MDV7143773.1 glutaminase [Tropicimonas sp. TH_r6]